MILRFNLWQLKTGPAFSLLVLIVSEEAWVKSTASYLHAAFKGLSSESVEVPIVSFHFELCFLTAFPLLFFQLWGLRWKKEEDIIAPWLLTGNTKNPLSGMPPWILANANQSHPLNANALVALYPGILQMLAGNSRSWHYNAVRGCQIQEGCWPFAWSQFSAWGKNPQNLLDQ